MQGYMVHNRAGISVSSGWSGIPFGVLIFSPGEGEIMLTVGTTHVSSRWRSLTLYLGGPSGTYRG